MECACSEPDACSRDLFKSLPSQFETRKPVVEVEVIEEVKKPKQDNFEPQPSTSPSNSLSPVAGDDASTSREDRKLRDEMARFARLERENEKKHARKETTKFDDPLKHSTKSLPAPSSPSFRLQPVVHWKKALLHHYHEHSHSVRLNSDSPKLHPDSPKLHPDSPQLNHSAHNSPQLNSSHMSHLLHPPPPFTETSQNQSPTHASTHVLSGINVNGDSLMVDVLLSPSSEENKKRPSSHQEDVQGVTRITLKDYKKKRRISKGDDVLLSNSSSAPNSPGDDFTTDSNRNSAASSPVKSFFPLSSHLPSLVEPHVELVTDSISIPKSSNLFSLSPNTSASTLSNDLHSTTLSLLLTDASTLPSSNQLSNPSSIYIENEPPLPLNSTHHFTTKTPAPPNLSPIITPNFTLSDTPPIPATTTTLPPESAPLEMGSPSPAFLHSSSPAPSTSSLHQSISDILPHSKDKLWIHMHFSYLLYSEGVQLYVGFRSTRFHYFIFICIVAMSTLTPPFPINKLRALSLLILCQINSCPPFVLYFILARIRDPSLMIGFCWGHKVCG